MESWEGSVVSLLVTSQVKWVCQVLIICIKLHPLFSQMNLFCLGFSQWQHQDSNSFLIKLPFHMLFQFLLPPCASTTPRKMLFTSNFHVWISPVREDLCTYRYNTDFVLFNSSFPASFLRYHQVAVSSLQIKACDFQQYCVVGSLSAGKDKRRRMLLVTGYCCFSQLLF